MPKEFASSRGVIIRDLMLFQLKLLIDGVKDVLVAQAALAAAIIDILFGGSRRGRLFYSVMRLSERFDLWLNLHGASTRAQEDRDGLFGVSRAGDDTLLGKVEEIVRGPEERRDRGRVFKTDPSPAFDTGGW